MMAIILLCGKFSISICLSCKLVNQRAYLSTYSPLCALSSTASQLLYIKVFCTFFCCLSLFEKCLMFLLGNAWLCGRLCCEVLRCCASKLASVRQEACAVLYLLMRSNFEFSGQKALTRVHLQVIISVSQLLGEIGGLNSTRFGESLNVINSFASSDKAMQSTGI